MKLVIILTCTLWSLFGFASDNIDCSIDFAIKDNQLAVSTLGSEFKDSLKSGDSFSHSQVPSYNVVVSKKNKTTGNTSVIVWEASIFVNGAYLTGISSVDGNTNLTPALELPLEAESNNGKSLNFLTLVCAQ